MEGTYHVFNPVHANNQLHHFYHSAGGGYFGGGSPAPGTGASRIRRDNDGKIRRKGDAKKIAESMKEDPTFAVYDIEVKKIKTKGKWLYGRCGLCDSFVNNYYHRSFCGYCGARLEWG